MHRAAIYVLFFAALMVHAAVSISHRHVQAAWTNVPPVPTVQGAKTLAFGDSQFAYRLIGLTIQNLGDIGGRTTPLSDYDYDRLGQWFMLEDALDPHSNFIPLLAAYYFGASQDPDDLGPVVDYLAMAGQRNYGEKWRWLAQAVYLARFRQNDLNRALELANVLANLGYEGMPLWTRQMPALILLAEGQKEAAVSLMVSILKDEADTLHPNEVHFMIDFICNRLLDKPEAASHPLCQGDE